MKQGNEAKSAAEANAKWQQAEQVLAKDLPTIPLWSTTRPVVWSTNLTNVKVDPFGQPDYADMQKK
ncbi:hypothetical protein [Raineyella fluvialis]|uniref:hypothetical protein n=1 Tax=Raineyella fluvialis TaxID=2662261 RepID=UPI001E36E6A1|nr:hypothetical protein [Raineyella fluvialis]